MKDKGKGEGRGKWCRRTRQEEREGQGAVEKERKVENALFFFFVVGAHARAIVASSRYISLPNLLYPMEIRHPSECVCVCTCILFERVAFVSCIGVTSCYCYVCTCTRVNICVLRDNDFSGITL